MVQSASWTLYEAGPFRPPPHHQHGLERLPDHAFPGGAGKRRGPHHPAPRTTVSGYGRGGTGTDGGGDRQRAARRGRRQAARSAAVAGPREGGDRGVKFGPRRAPPRELGGLAGRQPPARLFRGFVTFQAFAARKISLPDLLLDLRGEADLYPTSWPGCRENPAAVEFAAPSVACINQTSPMPGRLARDARRPPRYAVASLAAVLAVGL